MSLLNGQRGKKQEIEMELMEMGERMRVGALVKVGRENKT